MKKKCFSFFLALAMILSLPMSLSAAEVTAPDPIAGTIEQGANEGISVTSVANSSIGASRISNTSGSVTAYAAFSATASQASCTITLQEKYNGSWRTATGVPTTIYKKTVYNANSITAGKTFTLVSGKVYRAKIMFVDTNSSGTYYRTRYTGSF